MTITTRTAIYTNGHRHSGLTGQGSRALTHTLGTATRYLLDCGRDDIRLVLVLGCLEPYIAAGSILRHTQQPLTVSIGVENNRRACLLYLSQVERHIKVINVPIPVADEAVGQVCLLTWHAAGK